MQKGQLINGYPKITIVTPNYNQERFLEQTIQSVINQDYPNLEYIIMDGGSTDASVSIIKKYADRLTYWTSQKDKGMYDAINKGFERASGDLMGWINSDDILAEGALTYIAKVFSTKKHIQWLMGLPTIINERSEIIWQGQDAQVFSPSFFYLHNHVRTFSFIQQESTFWTRALWEKVGGKLDVRYLLAADFDLWMQFFRYEKLYFSHRHLGTFRRRVGQQSENKEAYLNEANVSVSINKKKLSLREKIVIFNLKSIRKIFQIFKQKRKYYKLQKILLGKPKWID